MNEEYATEQERLKDHDRQRSVEQRLFSLFVTAANALTAQGINTAANQANYGLVRNALEEHGLDFTVASVIATVSRGYVEGLSPNDIEEVTRIRENLDKQSRQQLLEHVEQYLESRGPESFKIRSWISDPAVPLADVRERVQLSGSIADNYSRDPQTNAQQFRKMFLSVSTPEQLTQQVRQQQDRHMFRSMSKQELRDYIKNQVKE